ncbi:MAG: hypothetical protein ACKOSS_00855 [Planctomycetia bacterium]
MIAPSRTPPPGAEARGGLDFLGPEFLTWLWWRATEQPTFTHPDGTEVCVLFDEHLEFRGERSAARKAVLRAGVPGASAEARAALRSGKVLVAARIVIARGEAERRVTLKAEDLDFSGVKLPAPEPGPARERLEAQLEALETLEDDLDLCLSTFLAARISPDWPAEVARIRTFVAQPSEDERSSSPSRARTEARTEASA